VIEWHRGKAGTVEMVHDLAKNGLGGGVLPSKHFGANAAWLRMLHDALRGLRPLGLPAGSGNQQSFNLLCRRILHVRQHMRIHIECEGNASPSFAVAGAHGP
jgi:hypothetical protein